MANITVDTVKGDITVVTKDKLKINVDYSVRGDIYVLTTSEVDIRAGCIEGDLKIQATDENNVNVDVNRILGSAEISQINRVNKREFKVESFTNHARERMEERNINSESLATCVAKEGAIFTKPTDNLLTIVHSLKLEDLIRYRISESKGIEKGTTYVIKIDPRNNEVVTMYPFEDNGKSL